MAQISAPLLLPVMSVCTGMVKVDTFTSTVVWGIVLMAFLHNRAAESHEIRPKLFKKDIM